MVVRGVKFFSVCLWPGEASLEVLTSGVLWCCVELNADPPGSARVIWLVSAQLGCRARPGTSPADYRKGSSTYSLLRLCVCVCARACSTLSLLARVYGSVSASTWGVGLGLALH